jgi:hypothetical protein
MPCPLLHHRGLGAMDHLVKVPRTVVFLASEVKKKVWRKCTLNLFHAAMRRYYLSGAFSDQIFYLKGVFLCRHTGSVSLRF